MILRYLPQLELVTTVSNMSAQVFHIYIRIYHMGDLVLHPPFNHMFINFAYYLVGEPDLSWGSRKHRLIFSYVEF